MYATYPVYLPSARYAREYDELELWRESYKINKECRDFINGGASEAFHDEKLPGFIKDLIDNYGLERAMYVIGRSVVGSDWDKRYDYDARARANMFDYKDMKEAEALKEARQDYHDHTTSYCSNVHPCILNLIFHKLMKLENEHDSIPQADNTPDNEHGEGVEQ